MQKITGQKDSIIKLLRELQSENSRKRNKLFFAEGEELVKRAFDYGGRVSSIIFTDKYVQTQEAQDIYARAVKAQTDAYYTTEGLLNKILDAKPTPECIAIVDRKVASISDIFEADCPLIQMVEQCENADNLGMLLRSTDAAGITGVVLTNSTDPFSRRVVRGSRGAVFTTPICINYDSAKTIEEAKKNNIQIIATSARTDITYTDIDYKKPTMVIVGNEHTGISDTVRESADAVVRIPMLGKINSLNIAVAASIMLYEAVRQRS